MIRLVAGNVLLKPSHRKQLMAWLRRAMRLGERIGDFVLTLSMQRIGRSYRVEAKVHDSAGDFNCRCHQHDWRDAVREIVWALSNRLQAQRLERA